MAQQTLSKPYWQVYLRLSCLCWAIIGYLGVTLQAQPTPEEKVAELHERLRQVRNQYLLKQEELRRVRDTVITLQGLLEAKPVAHSEPQPSYAELEAENKYLKSKVAHFESLIKENAYLREEIQRLEKEIEALQSGSRPYDRREDDIDIRLGRNPGETLIYESMFLLDRLKRFLRLH